MKRLIIAAAFIGCITAAPAELRFRHLDNNGATNITVVDTDSSASGQISKAVFTSADKQYEAKQIRCDRVGKKVVYYLKFKRLTEFSDCKLSLTIADTTHTIDIEQQLIDRARKASPKIKPVKPIKPIRPIRSRTRGQ